MPDETPIEPRTVTETMVRCMEDFGVSEPKRVLVIWLNSDEDICWSTNSPWSYMEIVGLLECVKSRTLHKWNRQD